MMENRSSTERVDRIMASLDSIHKAEAPDFFYTRLTGKMQGGEDKRSFFMLRPAFITSVLGVLLVVNVLSLFTMDKPAKPNETQSAGPGGIESFAKAYDMNTGSVYE
ncbi:MAG: hypothetical protein ABIN74_14575 [Ferruginibacter sp.]